MVFEDAATVTGQVVGVDGKTPVPDVTVVLEANGLKGQTQRTDATGHFRYDLVPKDCGRSDCHAKEEQAWLGTKHAHAARHEAACVRCHSVGFDPGATNGGFDEACPGGRCDEKTAVLGVVHCLACHGPGFRSAANYGEGSCAQCHDAPPKYPKVAEWRQAKMSHLTAGLEPAVQVSLPGCPDCHSPPRG